MLGGRKGERTSAEVCSSFSSGEKNFSLIFFSCFSANYGRNSNVDWKDESNYERVINLNSRPVVARLWARAKERSAGGTSDASCALARRPTYSNALLIVY